MKFKNIKSYKFHHITNDVNGAYYFSCLLDIKIFLKDAKEQKEKENTHRTLFCLIDVCLLNKYQHQVLRTRVWLPLTKYVYIGWSFLFSGCHVSSLT